MVFVPSRGFLFFYVCIRRGQGSRKSRFRPLTGISLFLFYPEGDGKYSVICFRPLTGISLFLYFCTNRKHQLILFSSPHGDFSFSIQIILISATRFTAFSSPHGDFSFSIGKRTARSMFWNSFRPLTGISLFLSYLIFPL